MADQTERASAIETLPAIPREALDPIGVVRRYRGVPADSTKAILLAFAASRVILAAVTGVAAMWRHVSPLSIWNQWDSVWYAGIAVHGYAWTWHGKSPLAFFPLYPLLLRFVSASGLPITVAGVILSNAAFLAALFYLHRLIRDEWNEQVAHRALLLIALFPTGFFTFAPYTEALFLLAATGTLYHARHHQAVAAGLWLAAALLTRSTGLILVLPAILLLRGSRLRNGLLCLAPGVCAWAAYLYYLHAERIPWTMLLQAQRGWHRAVTFPWTGFVTSLQWLAAHGATNIPWALENLLQLGCVAVFLVATMRAWPRLSAATRAYCAGFWVLIVASPEWLNGYYAPFSSTDRFVLVLFPLAGWTVMHVSGRRTHVGIAVSALLLTAATAVHLAGGWVG